MKSNKIMKSAVNVVKKTTSVGVLTLGVMEVGVVILGGLAAMHQIITGD